MRRSLWEHFCRRIQRWSGYELRRLQRLVIEPTNHCTRHCPICGAAQAQKQRAKGYMDWEVFVRLAAEAAVLRPDCIYLYAHGESLLHPRLVEMVRTLASRKLSCEITTNGDLLTPERSRVLREAGLAHLTLSHPGTSPANYEACRGCPPPEEDDRLIEALRCWETATAPVSIQSMIIPSLVAEPMKILDFAGQWLAVPGVRDVTFHHYLPWPRHFREDLLRTLMDTPRRCDLGMRCLTVLWDGTVTPCTFDVAAELAVGRFPDASLSQLYNGPALRGVRRSWFDQPPRWPAVCQACLIPRCHVPLVRIDRATLHRHTGTIDSAQRYARSILKSFDSAGPASKHASPARGQPGPRAV